MNMFVSVSQVLHEHVCVSGATCLCVKYYVNMFVYVCQVLHEHVYIYVSGTT